MHSIDFNKYNMESTLYTIYQLQIKHLMPEILISLNVCFEAVRNDGLITVKDRRKTNQIINFQKQKDLQTSCQLRFDFTTLSCIMTNFSVPLKNPKSGNDIKWYSEQPDRIDGFFDSIGFTDFDTNKDYISRSNFDTIGVACANRQVDDYTVIGVGIRSGGYFREWSNNVYLGDGSKSDYMHEGWYNAANKAINYINDYISTNNM